MTSRGVQVNVLLGNGAQVQSKERSPLPPRFPQWMIHDPVSPLQADSLPALPPDFCVNVASSPTGATSLPQANEELLLQRDLEDLKFLAVS